MKEMLAQDLSTVLWLFYALGFIINVLKCSIAPSKQVDFLGFTVNTNTVMVILPSVKMSQSEVSRALQCCTLNLKTLSHLLGKLVATKPAVLWHLFTIVLCST